MAQGAKGQIQLTTRGQQHYVPAARGLPPILQSSYSYRRGSGIVRPRAQNSDQPPDPLAFLPPTTNEL